MNQPNANQSFFSPWPELFIAGAPRCGTTTLHGWLSQHPDIYMPEVKEPHFFSSINFPELEEDVLHVTRDKDRYLSLFADASSTHLKGEASSYYLADPESPRLIHDAVPEAKIIILLRDPIERAFSHYLLYSRRGEQPPFRQVIQGCLTHTPPYDNLAYNIVELGCYHQQLYRYYQYFNPEQIHIVLFSNLHNNPEGVLSGIFDFLEVDKEPVAYIPTGDARNAYMEPRNKLFSKLLASQALTSLGLKLFPRSLLKKIRYNVLLQKGEKPQLDNESKRILVEEYKEDIASLEQLLDRDLSPLRESWLQTGDEHVA